MRLIERLRADVDEHSFDKAIEVAGAKLREESQSGGLESAAAPTADIDATQEMIRTGKGLEGGPGPVQSGLEAIILGELRPAWFIRDDKIVVAGDFDRLAEFESNRIALEAIAKTVGRVDLLNHATQAYVGTGWLVDKDIVVTNRHVAETFTRPAWPSGWDFATGTFGRPLRVEINTVQQLDTDPSLRRPMTVTEVLYVAGQREPDIAFLRVLPDPAIDPIPLAATLPAEKTAVAAIGYPASDATRNDPDLMRQIFGIDYDVKRFSPGLANDYIEDGALMLTDYTTLGGNSGSAVVALETGKAVGLHFAGLFGETNYAVSGDILAATLRSMKSSISLSGFDALPDHAERRKPSHFDGRQGYDPAFLGDGALRVDFPDLGGRADDVAPVEAAADGILRYTHFSVIQSKSRRLPMLAAVNIDGAKAFALKRKGSWHTDGRIDEAHQVDNVLYKHNPLDRGHMVRRKDPGWGDSEAEAKQGEIDTFMYTNCAPQHEDLNQKDWVGLEDYILEAADTKDFKVSVMTGPIFRDSDRRLKSQPGAEDVQIPEAYWKLAVMVNEATGTLSATAYLLTHGDLIRDLTEAAFVFGEYKTYQIKVSKLSALTGFDFSAMSAYDPLAPEPEGLFGRAARQLDGADSLTL